mmetsp:Transcript_17114/g.22194  ORF Transcript_17114/g.22194 Transcript_17114/m.22194 type:complete len:133 (+) Transcript_17114:22-420(+)
MSIPSATVLAIRDGEHFEELMQESEKKLLVIDCHQCWCGPCTVVEPTYNALNTELDDCRERVLFLTADVVELATQLAELLKETDIDLANHGCMPFFLIVKNHSLHTTIFGADVPKLKQVVSTQAPAYQKPED